MSLLSINNLSLSFGSNKVINNISLEISKGEMLAIVGESGSGKSLMALSCLGLQPKGATISGSIVLNGEEMIGANEATFRSHRGKTASMIFQEPMTALNPLHTIGKQIGEMLSVYPERANSESKDLLQHGKRSLGYARDENIINLINSVGLSHFKNRLDAYPHQLSGGERQRVMIAMAIANHPALLIADEPTTAVDVTIQATILKLLKELQTSMQMAMMFITHDLTIVRQFADHVVVMKQGEIVEQGKVADIFAAPKHPYTQKLLASEPKGSPLPLPTNAKPVISCESLKVYFPIKNGLLGRISGYIKAVDDISISLTESMTLGIAGESGSGKTTLAFALLRLIKSEGKIVYMGEHIEHRSGKSLRALRNQLQLVFQDPYSSLNPRMNISQIIGEGLLVHEPNATDHAARIADILQRVGLPPDMANRYPHEFSGGQRQRIAIARAMVLRPKFVVLDEPTSALDLTIQTQIIDLLKEFQKEYGISYLFISHDLRVLRAISHELVIMQHGKLVEHGKTTDILTSPKQEYTKRLIDAAMLS